MVYNLNIDHAKQYGVDEAIMINNFQYWVMKNKANGINCHEGKTWTYNSVRSYVEIYPFWTSNQIERILTSLRNQGVLIVGNYNKAKYDRTKWYAFADEQTFIEKPFSIPGKAEMEFANQRNGIGEIKEPIPTTKTKTTKTLYYKEMIAIYDGFCKKVLDIPASINKVEGNAMKTIIKRLIEISKFKGHDESGCLDSFKYILNNWDELDDFTRKQVKLTQIASNLTNIISQLKNGKRKSSGSSLAEEILNKYK